MTFNPHQFTITSPEEYDRIAGKKIPVDDARRLNGGADFGTDIFKNDFLRSALYVDDDLIIDVGLGSGLSVNVIAGGAVETKIVVGPCIEQKYGDIGDEYTITEIDPKYKRSIYLTNEEIDSFDNHFDLKKFLVEKTYKEFSENILPEVIALEKIEAERRLNKLERSADMVRDINSLKQNSPDMGM